MKRFLNLLLLAGALTLLPSLNATPRQSSAAAAQPKAAAGPQAKASSQESSPKRHHRAHTNTTHGHRRHMASAKH